MKTHRWIVALLFGALALQLWAGPVISYQGMVNVAGTPFNGVGYFKFSLRGPGGEGLWNHDGSPPAGAPVGVLTVSVQRGLFHVPLGDTGMRGMSPIAPLTLHAPQLWLRTWFSTNGTIFEQLVPDVPLRIPDWSQFNSGSLLVAGNAGDAVSLSEALNYMRSNEWIQAVWLMPGYYEAIGGISMPTDRWVVIRGFDKAATWVDGGESVGILLGQGRLQDLTVMGQPAISDQGVSTVNVELVHCDVQGNSGALPAFWLIGANSHVRLRDVRVETPSGVAMQITGNADVDARRCDVELWGGRGTGIVVSSRGRLTLADSVVGVGTGAALAVVQAQDGSWVRCSGSSLNGSLVISESNNQTVELQSCRIWADSAHGAAVQVRGSGEWGELILGQCWVDCWETPAVVARVAEQEFAQVTLRESRVRVWNLPVHEAAMAMTALPEGYGGYLQMISSELSTYGSNLDTAAIRLSNAELDATHSRIHSGSVGIEADKFSEVHLGWSEVEADETGIRLADGSTLETQWSRIAGGEGALPGAPGLELGIAAQAISLQSWFEASGMGNYADGIRIPAAPNGSEPSLVLAGGGAFGASRGIKAESGLLRVVNALVATEEGIPMDLGTVEGAPPREVACFGSTFFRLSAAALPAVRLSGPLPPVPLMAGCLLDAPGSSVAVDAPGAPVAHVELINSVLSTNLAPNVSIRPASSSLGQGNYIR